MLYHQIAHVDVCLENILKSLYCICKYIELLPTI